MNATALADAWTPPGRAELSEIFNKTSQTLLKAATVLHRKRHNSRVRSIRGGTVMLRKTILALSAVAAMAMMLPGAASARGGFGGGGFHGGGFHGGGFHGGGFHGFHGRGFGFGAGLGLGYGLYGPGYYDYPYAYDDSYEDGGCYLVRQRIHTRHGWRIRRVEVCS
jgi:hypothetical protein